MKKRTYDYDPSSGEEIMSHVTQVEDVPKYWETQLVKYDLAEKIALTTVVSIITTLALFGNVLTIGVVLKRKQRALFATCLISLAISDILYTSATSTYYISQFLNQSASLWYLGDTLCRLIPFLQNLTIMVNSFTLVMIAFDRYMALNKLIKGKWEPGETACSILFLFIWAITAGISSSALWNYKNYRVEIYIPPDNPLDPLEFYNAHMCVADKEINGRYYVLVFAFVFVPTTLVFIWLNTIIATEIWERRKAVHKKMVNDSKSSGLSEQVGGGEKCKDGNYRTVTSSTNAPTTKITAGGTITTGTTAFPRSAAPSTQDLYNKSSTRTEREARHIRMFKVIICLIAVFLVCRLPNWIFLLYKLHATVNAHKFWLLQYSLGILALCNCMLNPLMYTFLSETLKICEWFKQRVQKCFSMCRSNEVAE